MHSTGECTLKNARGHVKRVSALGRCFYVHLHIRILSKMLEIFFWYLQVWGSVQHKGVQALATLDEKLEQTPLLEELDPNEMPDEVTDSNGKITQDCSEVWVWL